MSKGRAASGEGSVFKAKDGRWNAFVTIGRDENGKLKRKRFTGKTQAEVVRKKKEFMMSKGIATVAIAAGCHLDEYMLAYINRKLVNGRVRQTSYDRDMRTFHNQIKPRIGQYLLKDITAEIIQNEVINDLREKKFSYSTTHKAFILIHETIKDAIQRKYIIDDPCLGVFIPDKEHFVDIKEIRYLTNNEREEFISVANLPTVRNNDYKYGKILCLIFYTGLRGGELCALKWQDINFDKKIMIVRRDTAVVNEYDKNDNTKHTRKRVEQNTTKNSKIRQIPLNNKALEILKRQKELVGGSANDYVINGCKDIVVVSDLDKCYGFIAKKAKIDNPQGVHTLRHTFASLAIKDGMDAKVISEILGHSSVAFTYKTYIHIFDEMKMEAMNRINDL